MFSSLTRTQHLSILIENYDMEKRLCLYKFLHEEEDPVRYGAGGALEESAESAKFSENANL